jgi:hypothetical protein
VRLHSAFLGGIQSRRLPAESRNNGWSLIGLAESLHAQRKTAETADVRKQFKATWTHPDVQLTTSRL